MDHTIVSYLIAYRVLFHSPAIILNIKVSVCSLHPLSKWVSALTTAQLRPLITEFNSSIPQGVYDLHTAKSRRLDHILSNSSFLNESTRVVLDKSLTQGHYGSTGICTRTAPFLLTCEPHSLCIRPHRPVIYKYQHFRGSQNCIFIHIAITHLIRLDIMSKRAGINLCQN